MSLESKLQKPLDTFKKLLYFVEHIVILKVKNPMEYNTEKYKVYTWKNWMILHWMINPGLVVNELILGQKVPKVSLEDKLSDKPRYERSFVPCPHCKKLHDGRTWSTQNGTAFKNWFGLYCPNCGEIIPCIMNVFSFLILAITYPLWGWFKSSMKENRLSKQPGRYQKRDFDLEYNPYDNFNWWKTGLSWGAMMYVIMSIAFPFFSGSGIELSDLLIGLVKWTIGGLLFGYMMKLIMNKTMTKKGKITKASN